MARKHLDIIRQREFKASVRRFERQEKHQEMLQQHKDWKASRSNPLAEIEAVEETAEV